MIEPMDGLVKGIKMRINPQTPEISRRLSCIQLIAKANTCIEWDGSVGLITEPANLIHQTLRTYANRGS
jgi:hypothetical protein